MASFFQGAYGTKPNYGNIQSLINNPKGKESAFNQLQMLYPQLSSQVGQIGTNISQELQGQLPTDVTNQIKDQGAAWGLNTGMPGSGAEGNYTLENLGLNSLQEQQQGMSNYLNFVPALQSQFSFTQPETADVLQALDVNAAAPNPDTAALNKEMMSQMGTGEGILTSFI